MAINKQKVFLSDKNMEHIWSLLCRDSSIDIDNNLLSIFGCFEKIELGVSLNNVSEDSKLVAPIDFQIVNFWEATETDKDSVFTIKIELEDPNNKILPMVEKEFNIKKGTASFRNRMKFQGLTISISGKYRFNIYKKDENDKKYRAVASLPLLIQINKIAQTNGN